MDNNIKRASAVTRRRKRIAKRKKAMRNILLFFTVYLLLMAIIGVSIFVSLHKKEKTNPDLYSLSVVTDEESPTVFSGEDIYFDDKIFIPSVAINALENITLTLDNTNVGFIIDSNSEYAQFKLDSNKANINGNEVEISEKVKFIDNVLYLPLDLFENHLSGINIEKDDKAKTYLLSKAEETLSFILKKPSVTEEQSEKEASDTTESPLDFTLDLSSYEEYMNPKDRDEYLFLVSAEFPLDENYIPTDLMGSIYTRDDGRATQKLRKYACLALEAFLKEAEACGIYGVSVTSGYRSYQYQNQLFEAEIQITGSVEEASKNVNPPGISEHQSGLCIDMHNLPAASTAFGGTKEADWLAENAHKFGYILRYPKNKVSVTKINYEPWHFRYVGRYHATKMYELDMCLEEYIEYINK